MDTLCLEKFSNFIALSPVSAEKIIDNCFRLVDSWIELSRASNGKKSMFQKHCIERAKKNLECLQVILRPEEL